MGSRVGKLVKKNDKKVMSLLDMESYPWLHFSEQGIVFPDNVKKSVILEKMHDPLEIKEKVTKPKDFDNLLVKKSVPLLPRDMTEDFKKGQREMLRRRRRTLLDEEEAMALELAEMENQEIEKKIKSNVKKKKEDDNKLNANQVNKIEDQKQNQQEKMNPTSQTTTMESSSSQNHSEPIKQELDEEKIKEKYENAYHEGFGKGRHEGFEKGEIEGKEEGYKKGFEEGSTQGYRNAEERGMVAVETKYDRAFANISEAASKMEQLKSSLLMEGKEIFLELVKLCCEKIIREQIKNNDSSLTNLFDEVVKAYSASTSITIQMNHEDAQRIKKHIENLNEGSRIQIKENSSLQSGSFHVENETGVSMVDIEKSVDNIIKNLKSEIFNDQKIDKKEENLNKDSEIKKVI
ncbi:FliH/SctL family protein [Silvanigrella aquatica]|uniref:Flagellar assembly protein FliH n=1 Tax=Silvanigrella aquatica TaxID=1915309 RepID=A0A1L4CZQ9_9BACT|nr:FliH/SctL family protein [Silvanigrella aquatica]APJ03425.1 hypothetical protein AXG55_05705 [Silvanigrella aquatica]